jgi:hypothetical protein
VVQNHNIKIENEFFENVAKFKCLGTTVTSNGFIHEEIKSRLNVVNVYYHSFQNLLSSCLLSKNIEIEIYRTIILYVLCRCETCYLTLREDTD